MLQFYLASLLYYNRTINIELLLLYWYYNVVIIIIAICYEFLNNFLPARPTGEQRQPCLVDHVERPNLTLFSRGPRIEDATGAVRRALWWIVHRGGEWPLWRSCGQRDGYILFWILPMVPAGSRQKMENICRNRKRSIFDWSALQKDQYFIGCVKARHILTCKWGPRA